MLSFKKLLYNKLEYYRPPVIIINSPLIYEANEEEVSTNPGIALLMRYTPLCVDPMALTTFTLSSQVIALFGSSHGSMLISKSGSVIANSFLISAMVESRSN